MACTAASTCEAETLSLDSAAGLLGLSCAVRKEGIPLQALMSAVLGRAVKLVAHEDNTQCIAAVKKGYSAALRHLPRTQRLALGAMHEVFYGDEDQAGEAAGNCRIAYCESGKHKGDVFTKALSRVPFRSAIERLGMRGPSGWSRRGLPTISVRQMRRQRRMARSGGTAAAGAELATSKEHRLMKVVKVQTVDLEGGV